MPVPILSQKISELLKRYGMTNSDLGRVTGVSPNAVRGWTEGAHPRPSKIKAIADYFGLPVDVLLNDSIVLPDQPAPPSPPKKEMTFEERIFDEFRRLNERLDRIEDRISKRFPED